MALIEAIINGLMMGSVYSLLALGLTLVFGVMRVINFAHGSLISLAMLLTYFFTTSVVSNYVVSAFLTVFFLFAVGYLIQHALLNPVFRKSTEREPVGILLLTAGLSYSLDALFQVIFGPYFRMTPTFLSNLSWYLGEITISVPRFVATVSSFVAFGFTWFFLRKTWIGRAIRAVGQDREAARLFGLYPLKVYSIAFALGAALTAIGAVTLVPFYYVHPTVGSAVFGTKCFIIVVLGGLGSVGGALLGGLIIGLLEAIIGQYFSSLIATVAVFAVFLAVLYVKPSGLMGSRLEW